jgi:hypothetical protein
VERDITVLLLRLGLLAVLYFFLFQLLVVLWRDLRAPERGIGRTQAGASLDLLDAAAANGPATFPLGALTSLGRGPQNSIVLADQSVSAEHALISSRLGQWWVEDIGSTNGSFLNDERLTQPAVIQTGDIIRLGVVRLRVRL